MNYCPSSFDLHPLGKSLLRRREAEADVDAEPNIMDYMRWAALESYEYLDLFL